jgi:phospholipid/cholesterol/gamma-HCH transport system substrate-binding protein
MSEKNYTSRVGWFVFLGLALIAALMLNFSRGVGFFKPRYELNMNTRTVAGLKEGADVYLSGVKIGSVKKIKLEQKKKGVQVQLTILEEFPLHTDSKFMIEQQGVLGDQFVNIVPGTPEAPLLKDGDAVEGTEPFNLNEVAQSANGLIKQFEKLGATVENAIERLNTQVLDTRTLSNLSQTIENFQEVPSHAIQLLGNASGVISNAGPMITLSLTNLHEFSRKLNKVAMEVDETIVSNRVELNDSMKNLRDATASMKNMMADLEAGKGLAGGLLKDEQTRAQFALTVSNLSVLSSNLARFGLLHKPKEPSTGPSWFRGKGGTQ